MEKRSNSWGTVMVIVGLLVTFNLFSSGRSGCSRVEKVSIDLDEALFREHVLEASGVVLVDFWADWCGPCHRFAPTFETVAAEYEGRATFCKVDIDRHRRLAAVWKIQSIPCVWLFKDGAAVEARTGVLSRGRLEAWLEEHL
ncbi:MAG: thioredoxin [Verrucomicrobiota bacterium]